MTYWPKPQDIFLIALNFPAWRLRHREQPTHRILDSVDTLLRLMRVARMYQMALAWHDIQDSWCMAAENLRAGLVGRADRFEVLRALLVVAHDCFHWRALGHLQADWRATAMAQWNDRWCMPTLAIIRPIAPPNQNRYRLCEVWVDLMRASKLILLAERNAKLTAGGACQPYS